ncbi:MAG: hypothetical protein U1D06_15240, partial [Paracoccaceae bacterium]|nr:hypothetical protein [Paracoccaceae bacterium]
TRSRVSGNLLRMFGNDHTRYGVPKAKACKVISAQSSVGKSFGCSVTLKPAEFDIETCSISLFEKRRFERLVKPGSNADFKDRGEAVLPYLPRSFRRASGHGSDISALIEDRKWRQMTGRHWPPTALTTVRALSAGLECWSRPIPDRHESGRE